MFILTKIIKLEHPEIPKYYLERLREFKSLYFNKKRKNFKDVFI